MNSNVLAARAIAIRNEYLQNPDTSVADFELHETALNPATILPGFMHPDLESFSFFHPQKPKAKIQTATPSQARPQLTLTQVRRYLGRYYSEELDVFYSVELGDDGYLLFKAPRILPYIVRTDQVEADGSFISPDYNELVGGPTFWGRFTRDESGAVDGMLLSSVRVTDLKFIKVTTPPFD
ncbi:hypothetical protein K8I31_00640 [bacterium]|nr:hypothetical protein [bacterium]